MCSRHSDPVVIKQDAPQQGNETTNTINNSPAPAVSAPNSGDGGLSQDINTDNGLGIKRKGKRSLKIATGGGSGNSTGLNI